MVRKLWENEYRSTMICIDSYNNSVPVGRFYNPYYHDGIFFNGVIDLIKKIEAMFDEMNFPQSFTSTRSFSEKSMDKLNRPSAELKQAGNLATFSLQVIYRRNTTWQGTVSCMGTKEKREKPFRSILELLFLIDSAITEDFSKKS